MLQALQDIPPGQRQALVHFVAASVQRTLQDDMSRECQAALLSLLQGTLKGGEHAIQAGPLLKEGLHMCRVASLLVKCTKMLEILH